MLSLAKVRSPEATQTAFNEFFVWGLYLRGSAGLLAFVALLWALSVPYHADKRPWIAG
jgi:hypothetical protein